MSRPVIRGFGGQRRIYAPQFRTYELEEFGDAFEERGGYSRREIQQLELFPPLPDEDGIYQPAPAAPQYYPGPPPPLPAPVHVPTEIEREAHRPRRHSEPLRVSEGRVSTFGLVGMMPGTGDPVFGAELEEHCAARDRLQKLLVPQVPGPDGVDAYYEDQFRRLELELELQSYQGQVVTNEAAGGYSTRS